MSRSVHPPSKTGDFAPPTRAAAGRRGAPAARLAQPSTARDAWPRLGLRAQVALAAGVMVFIIAGVLGGLLSQDFAVQSRVRAGESLQADAIRIADQLNKQMAARSRELFLLGSLDPMYALHDGRQVQSLLTELRSNVPAYYWLGLTDATGHMVASTNPELLGGDFSKRPEIQEGLRGFSTGSEGAGGQGPASPEPLPMTLTYPVRGADGGIAGVMVAQLHWSWIRDLANSILTEGRNADAARGFVLINSQDRVLLGPRDLLGTTLSLAAVARARSGYLGWSAETWPDHKAYLTGAAQVQQAGSAAGPGSVPMQWTVVTRLDASGAFEATRVLRAQVALGGVLLALVAAALGWLAAGLVATPLGRLAVAVEQIGQSGGALPRPALPVIDRPREIARLTAALRRLLDTLVDGAAPAAAAPAPRRDPLTGVLDRDGVKAWLIERMRPDGGARGSLMVFLAGLDDLAAVNQSYGRHVGDAALVDVAARMTAFLRPTDTVARFGGDEFLIILDAPKGTADEAAEIAIFDLFDAVGGAPYDLGGLSIPLGISLGGAMWPDDAASIDQVIAYAAAALDAAKRAGKGRIIMHQPDQAAEPPPTAG